MYVGDRFPRTGVLMFFIVHDSKKMDRHAYFGHSINAQWFVSCVSSPSLLSDFSHLPQLSDNIISVSADGLDNANMTNLAIKGILAIRTMAEISRALDMADDYSSYSVNAPCTASGNYSDIGSIENGLFSSLSMANSCRNIWPSVFIVLIAGLLGLDV